MKPGDIVFLKRPYKGYRAVELNQTLYLQVAGTYSVHR